MTGQGIFSTHTKDSMFVKRKLKTPPNNSIEGMLTETKNDYCGISSAIFPSNLILNRSIGNRPTDLRFHTISLVARADAYIFIKNSTPFDLEKNVPRLTKNLFSYIFKKLLKQSEKHNKLSK